MNFNSEKTIFVMCASMQIGDVYDILYECQITAKANANFGNFCFNYDLRKVNFYLLLYREQR